MLGGGRKTVSIISAFSSAVIQGKANELTPQHPEILLMFTSSDFGRGGGARDVICTLMSMSRGQQLIKMTRLGPHLVTVSAATASRQFGGVRVILNYHRRSIWEFFRQVCVGGRSFASVSLFLFIFFFGLCVFCFVVFTLNFVPRRVWRVFSLWGEAEKAFISSSVG